MSRNGGRAVGFAIDNHDDSLTGGGANFVRLTLDKKRAVKGERAVADTGDFLADAHFIEELQFGYKLKIKGGQHAKRIAASLRNAHITQHFNAGMLKKHANGVIIGMAYGVQIRIADMVTAPVVIGVAGAQGRGKRSGVTGHGAMLSAMLDSK